MWTLTILNQSVLANVALGEIRFEDLSIGKSFNRLGHFFHDLTRTDEQEHYSHR